MVTRGPSKRRRCTRKRLAAVLRPYALRELKCSTISLGAPPDPLAAIWGLLLREREGGEGRGRGRTGEGKGKGE